tara:strand:+ start:268 stop:1125 length:858 start_codon:yes stop_codon:yes gene_type:complete
MWSLAAVVLLSGCGTTQQQPKQKPVASVPDESRIKAASRALEPGYKIGRPYRIAGQWYKPAEQFAGTEVGVASWYGPGFHGRTTANGERYDMYAFTAAHKTLQLPSVVRVKNLENGKAVIVRVNDRGPYIDGRVIDLSRKAAEALDLRYSGLANVKLTVLPKESRQLAAMAQNGASVGSMDDIIDGLNLNPPAFSTPQPPIRVAANRQSDGHFLQVAAFSASEYADRARTMLRGIGPVVIAPIERGDRTLYRVRVGPYGDRDQAKDALRRVREVGFEGAHLVAQG